MKERPIIFSGPMIRALLAGRKTQTRRIVKPQSLFEGKDGIVSRYPQQRGCPYGEAGESRLWVRESVAFRTDVDTETDRPKALHYAIYRADRDRRDFDDDWHPYKRWRPSIHMPRWASRITLELTDVRVERLNEISEADAKAEGVDGLTIDGESHQAQTPNDFVLGYSQLWDSIHGPGSWATNPFVWVIGFRVVTANRKVTA